MKSGFKRAITILGSLLLLALPLAAQTPTDTTATMDTVLTDTTATTETTWTETTLTETSTTEMYPTETASTTTYYEDDMDDGEMDEEGAKVCAACAAFGIALPLILLGISIAIALWVYRDAKSRGITSAPLWAILGFLFNILGLVIYLIARNGMTPPSSSAPGSTMAPPPPPPHV